MGLDSNTGLLLTGVSGVVIALMLTVYEYYTFVVYIGVFLVFLIMLYLAMNLENDHP